ncbi:MAG: superoxide dismutase family protein, partial [Cyanophyceae cyanobacterium]
MAGGVAVLQPDGSNVRGVVRFIKETGRLRISYRVTGLTDGEHGFHIHEYGDLTDGCTSACAHFNPDGMTHGGLDTHVRHFGDLGNITSSKGVAEGELFLDDAKLDTSHYGILGRMIIVHADRDDLGEGGDEESLKTGNAGKRLACGVIGLADPDTDTMTMDSESISLATLGVGVAAAGIGFMAGRRDSRILEAPYQPDQEISDYTARDLATSSAITGDFTTDSLKYGFGPTSLSAEDNYDATYGKAQAKIRRRLKNKLMGEATMGT